MPKPMSGSPEDKALWIRAEQLAETLLDERERAIADAIEDAYCHKEALLKGEPADTAYSEQLFREAQDDMEMGVELANRVWTVLCKQAFAT
jgi:hypothetical protein